MFSHHICHGLWTLRYRACMAQHARFFFFLSWMALLSVVMWISLTFYTTQPGRDTTKLPEYLWRVPHKFFQRKTGLRQPISLPFCTRMSPCHFAVVADLDQQSLSNKSFPLVFHSYILGGRLYWDDNSLQYKVHWAPKRITITGMLNEGGRGLEFSELIFFDQKLFMFDDRTGAMFEYLRNGNLVPKIILTETKFSAKGMKVEWATVKDNTLWVGSFGKEYIDPYGQITSYNKFQIALINVYGTVKHIDWRPVYQKIRKHLNLEYPAYLMHEAVTWSSHLSKFVKTLQAVIKRQLSRVNTCMPWFFICFRWIFLPRRASTEPYNELDDEKRGTNLMIVAAEDFSDIQVNNISGVLHPERGFSSFKFIPGTSDTLILALKSVEDSINNIQESYITVLETKTGKVLLEDQKLPFHDKYEGLEFIPTNMKFPFTDNEPLRME